MRGKGGRVCGLVSVSLGWREGLGELGVKGERMGKWEERHVRRFCRIGSRSRFSFLSIGDEVFEAVEVLHYVALLKDGFEFVLFPNVISHCSNKSREKIKTHLSKPL
jgi:hypothetical protein